MLARESQKVLSVPAHMDSRLPRIDEPHTTPIILLQPDHHLALSMIEIEDPARMFHPEAVAGKR